MLAILYGKGMVSNYEDVKFHCFLTKKTNNAMTFPNIFFGLNIYMYIMIVIFVLYEMNG